MIDIKEDFTTMMINKAIKQIDMHDGPQLVSVTEKMHKTEILADPSQIFEAAKELTLDRFFWASTEGDFYIVGIGNAYEITGDESRLKVTEEKWEQLLDKALIYNPYQVPGTGAVALGGMSFDPKKKRTKLWKEFKSSQFVLPEVIITKWKNTFYSTKIAVVNREADPIHVADRLDEIQSRVLINAVDSPTGVHVVEKKEIALDKWREVVHKAINEIKNQRVNKIVLAREMRLKLNKKAEIGVMLKKLLEMQSNSYVFAFEQGEDCFIGATPERLVKVNERLLLSACLAGTAPRGKTASEDKKISEMLLNDTKNRAEHDYVVEMIRSKIEDYCDNVQIPLEPVIYPLKNLQHLYTPVTATLKNGSSIFRIIKQLHPTPALGGMPREQSIAFIREHELLDRGWYGSPIGWLDSNQNGEFAVGIRSGLVQGDEVSLFAGCGIMQDSDPEAEYEETNIKFLPMLSVLEDS